MQFKLIQLENIIKLYLDSKQGADKLHFVLANDTDCFKAGLVAVHGVPEIVSETGEALDPRIELLLSGPGASLEFSKLIRIVRIWLGKLWVTAFVAVVHHDFFAGRNLALKLALVDFRVTFSSLEWTPQPNKLIRKECQSKFVCQSRSIEFVRVPRRIF